MTRNTCLIRRHWLDAPLVSLGLALSACTQPPTTPGNSSLLGRETLAAMAGAEPQPVTAPATSVPNPQRWSGHMTLKLDPFGSDKAKGVNMTFDLQGHTEAGQLDLSTPLGTLMAQVQWQGGQATLTTAEGHQSHDSLDTLTRSVLGESLPVAALFAWLAGQDLPVAGWQVDASGMSEGLLVARRPGTARQRGATLRVRLDR